MVGTATTKWVYAVVKSFTANGSLPCEQSYRAISRRAGVDDKTVKNSIQKLIQNKWLEYLGEDTHLGGSYPILKVRTNTALKFGARPQLSAEFNPETAESSPESAESQAPKSAITKETKENILFSKKIGEENSEVGLTPEKRKKIWDAVNSWSVEKLVQKRGTR